MGDLTKFQMKAETAKKADKKAAAKDPLLAGLLSEDFGERRKAEAELERLEGARRTALATALLAEATKKTPTERSAGALRSCASYAVPSASAFSKIVGFDVIPVRLSFLMRRSSCPSWIMARSMKSSQILTPAS